MSRASFAAPRVEVFSNTTAAPYPREPLAIRELLAEHLVRPVRFVDEIEALYAAGARLFVEVGPRNVLTRLASQILGERPQVAIAVDLPRRCGLTQLQHALGQLAAHGVPLHLERLFRRRTVRRLNLDALEEEIREKPLSPTTWLVNGGRARPLHELASPPRRAVTSSPVPGHVGGDDQAIRPTWVSPPAVQPPAAGRGNGSGRSESARAESPPSAPALVATPALPVPTTLGPVAAAQLGDEAGQVMLQFQHLMSRFLETQRSVMSAYLQGVPGAATAPLLASQRSRPETLPDLPGPAPVSVVPGPLSVSAIAESDTLEVPTPGTSAAVPVAGILPDREQLTQQLLQIVSERTGYPPGMLDLDVDIEADLGIDSIKRVEILGALQRACVPSDRQVGQEAMEQLTGIRTLRGIVDWIDNALRTDGEERESQGVEEQMRAPLHPCPSTQLLNKFLVPR